MKPNTFDIVSAAAITVILAAMFYTVTRLPKEQIPLPRDLAPDNCRFAKRIAFDGHYLNVYETEINDVPVFICEGPFTITLRK